MASMTINGLDEYIAKMSAIYETTDETLKKVVWAGAQPVADEIRSGLARLPKDKFRRLSKDDEFVGVPSNQLRDLLDGLGVAPPSTKDGFTNTKIGFAGYGRYPTNKYPKGIPNALLARAIESGSSVRKKTPFIRKAVSRMRARSIEAMQTKYEEELKIFEL